MVFQKAEFLESQLSYSFDTWILEIHLLFPLYETVI